VNQHSYVAERCFSLGHCLPGARWGLCLVRWHRIHHCLCLLNDVTVIGFTQTHICSPCQTEQWQ